MPRPQHLRAVFLLLATWCGGVTQAQGINEDEVGAWYMYFWDWRPENSDQRWGVQGDAQYRSWNLGGDLQQILVRGALTYRPKSADVMFAAGYAFFTTGVEGGSSARVNENRTHLDINLPQRVGSKFFLRHRFRFEQRWVQGQDFRTRWRYALFANIPLNRESLGKGTWYLSFFDEIFINGETDVGTGRDIDRFDRNWLFGAVGYGISDRTNLLGGYMHETTSVYNKGYLQFSLTQQF